GSKRGVQIAEPLKVNAVLMHTSGLGHGQEQQVQVFWRFGQPRQESVRLPASLRRHAGLTVRPPMERLDQEVPEAVIELWQGERRLCALAHPQECAQASL